MNAEQVPPRPDGMHPTPGPPPPPVPTRGIGDRPRATWNAWEAVAVYVVAILIGGVSTLPILGAVDDEDVANLAASAVAAVVTVGVLLAWLSTSHHTWRAILGLPAAGTWWREIRTSIGFGLLLYPGMVFGVGLVVSVVISAISGEPAQTPEQIPSELPVLGVVLAALYAIVIAPIHEELYFRGVLFRGVGDRWGLGVGLAASGLGFALIHYVPGPWEDALLLMGVMFFNGIALAWWYARRGTIVASIVAHMVFNVIGLTLILTIG
jgi:membrane protease YdiL (CAAX protease family)